MILNKVYFCSNFTSLQDLLANNEEEGISRCCGFLEEKIAIQSCLKDKEYSIRIWKTNVWFDYWYNSEKDNVKNIMAILNYSILDSFIKIKYLYVNDGNLSSLYPYLLNKDESEHLIESLIDYLKKIAIKNKLTKIIVDIHENLRIFKKYYYCLGFDIMNQKCRDNPFWIKAELNIR